MSKKLLTDFEIKILNAALDKMSSDLIYERWFGIFKTKKKSNTEGLRNIYATIKSIKNKLRL
jgi:hypothetical protein